MKLHIVKDGDSISALSEKYAVDPERIRSANPQLAEAESLTRGTKVKIPAGPVTMRKEKASVPQEARLSESLPEVSPYGGMQALGEPYGGKQAPPEEPFAPDTLAQRPETKPESGEGGVIGLPKLTYPFEGQDAHTNGSPYTSQEAVPLPAYFKTELPTSSYSPLHVKWSGMGESDAVHPYAPLPVPVVPAGANTSGSFGYGAVPAAPTGFMPYGLPYAPDVTMMPGYGPMVDPFAPVYPGFLQGSGGCGCRASSASHLPYALPLRSAASPEQAFTSAVDATQAVAAAAAAAEPAKAESAKTETVKVESAKTEPAKKRPRGAKKRVRVASRTDSLRSFLRLASSKPKPAHRRSKPWVND